LAYVVGLALDDGEGAAMGSIRQGEAADASDDELPVFLIIGDHTIRLRGNVRPPKAGEMVSDEVDLPPDVLGDLSVAHELELDFGEAVTVDVVHAGSVEHCGDCDAVRGIVKGAHVPLRKRWHLRTAQATARPSRSAETDQLRSDLARVRQQAWTVRHGS
jgi:hypothetical protein